jgi:haloacid dehalogenase superfamily, subfamily IA, variant 3 with third motif having DD or ED/haloacid dehalogenase superfamily, subfamily IA, variant 1 with third motif having Dx(3-4)D or Dx(3-4)E
MSKFKDIQGLIFDYGATIDSNGKHWAEVLWDAYQSVGVPVSKQAFRDAYVYGERYLALHPVVTPEFTFLDVLLAKTRLQITWLIENGHLTEGKTSEYAVAVSNECYTFAQSTIEKAKPILKQLSEKYQMVLVSNFYGNIETVLTDFGLADFFEEIVESAVVGVRKPDPAIFALGVKALEFSAENIVVVGDSHKKDIAPAQSLGCKTIWIKGPAWEEECADLSADAVIYDFSELKDIFQLD